MSKETLPENSMLQAIYLPSTQDFPPSGLMPRFPPSISGAQAQIFFLSSLKMYIWKGQGKTSSPDPLGGSLKGGLEEQEKTNYDD